MTPEPLRRFLRTMSRDDFDALVRSEAGLLHAAARSVTGDTVLAEDAVQEVFVKLLESPPLVSEVDVPRGWLLVRVLGVARNLLRAEKRRDRRERGAAWAESSSTTSANREDEIDIESMHTALAALPDDQRAAVELRYFGALSAEEIGRTLGCARRTVDERLAAARESLRRTLHARTLGVLFLESSEAGTPFHGTTSLVRRLQALRTHPAVKAGSASTIAPGSVLLAVAALLGLVGAVWLRWGAGSPSVDATTAMTSTNGALPAGEARAELEVLAESGANRSRQAPEVRDTTALVVASREAPAAGELRVHVVDANGTHVRTGVLRLEPASFSASAAVLGLLMREDLARFADLLEPIPLATENPLCVRDLPAELLLQDFEACAVVPGFGTPEPVKFQITADAPCELRLVLPAPRTLLVRVIDRDAGTPIESASVLSVSELARRDQDANEALESGAIGAARTDATGTATLAGLGAGAHTVDVQARGYASATLETDAQLEHVDVALARAPATAVMVVDVVDGAHFGMPGIEVVAKASGRELERRVESDERGRVVFRDLEPGYWSFAIEGLAFTRACVGKGWNTRDLRLYAAFELSPDEQRYEVLGFQFGTATWAVRVVDGGGVPVRDAELELSGPSQRAQRTNAAGWATFHELPVGRWRLELSGWTHVERDLAHHGDARDTIVLSTGQLEGRVTDAEERPVQGAWVMVRHVQSGARASKHSGVQGEFQLLHVPPGECVLDAASPSGSSGASSVTATAGVVREIVLRLQPRTTAK